MYLTPCVPSCWFVCKCNGYISGKSRIRLSCVETRSWGVPMYYCGIILCAVTAHRYKWVF